MTYRSIFFFVITLLFVGSGCKHTAVNVSQGITDLDKADIGIANRLEGWDGINNIFRDGPFYFSGQPDEPSFRRLVEEEGIRTIVSLRRPSELTGLDFDEVALLEDLGVTFVSVPMESSTFSSKDVDQFAEVLAVSDGPLLVHCGSSNRVGAMWASYLVRVRGFAFDDAVVRGRAAGITRDSMVELVQRIAE